MTNPFKLAASLFKGWTRKDFMGKREAEGWEKALKKGKGKISISNPQSSRYWINGDDSKYYDTNELEKGETPSNVTQDTMTGSASGDLEKARVDSTAIDVIEYDPRTKVLSVAYKGGKTMYDFPNVPEEEFKALMEADSKGKYMANFIVPNYSINRSK